MAHTSGGGIRSIIGCVGCATATTTVVVDVSGVVAAAVGSRVGIRYSSCTDREQSHKRVNHHY